MGQSKDGGYLKKDTLSPEVMSLLQQITGNAQGYTNSAAEGFKQFLPGGGGGEAIKADANRNFQQQTIPSILNSFGQGTKGSTSLNQALASGGQNLNSELASMLSQLQLKASEGIGNLGLNSQQQALGTPSFAYLQRQASPLQQITQSALGATGNALSGSLGVRR